MPKLLFLFHGMGVHGSDWAKPVKDKLDEVAGRYEEFKGGKPALSKRVQYVPITYDHVFQDLLAEWDKSATSLGNFISKNGIPVKNVIDWLSGVSATESKFFWSHIVDVLLYRFFEIKKAEVRTRVLNDIVDKLNEEMKNGAIVEASVLAHSLGTSVAHDCLAYLGEHAIGNSEAFMTGKFRFKNVFMLANVSRVLETNPAVYQSVMKPLSADPVRAYCERYYNFRHKFDPIPAVRCFKPEGWGSDYRFEGGLDHFHDFNVHDYLHYLDHPAVHIPLIKGLVGPVIPNGERDSAISAYPKIALPGACAEKVNDFRVQLSKQIALIEESKDPMTLIKAGAQLYAAAQEVSDACR